MGAQALFDQCVTHLARQKFRSILGNKCRYRHPANGFMCAVGCLLKPEEYSPNMENKSIGSLLEERMLPLRLKPFSKLLYELQLAHDRSFDPDSLVSELRDIAQEHFLDNAMVSLITEWEGRPLAENGRGEPA